jgi:hypothetical protein
LSLYSALPSPPSDDDINAYDVYTTPSGGFVVVKEGELEKIVDGCLPWGAGGDDVAIQASLRECFTRTLKTHPASSLRE